jgi:hypothetical protein
VVIFRKHGGACVKRYLVAFVTCLISSVVAAGDLSAVAGHYRYQDYAATLPDGRVLKLQDLGAKDAFLDISEDGMITLRMTMLTGNPVVHGQSARSTFCAGQGLLGGAVAGYERSSTGKRHAGR